MKVLNIFFKVMSILCLCATGVTLWNKGLKLSVKKWQFVAQIVSFVKNCYVSSKYKFNYYSKQSIYFLVYSYEIKFDSSWSSVQIWFKIFKISFKIRNESIKEQSKFYSIRQPAKTLAPNKKIDQSNSLQLLIKNREKKFVFARCFWIVT